MNSLKLPLNFNNPARHFNILSNLNNKERSPFDPKTIKAYSIGYALISYVETIAMKAAKSCMNLAKPNQFQKYSLLLAAKGKSKKYL